MFLFLLGFQNFTSQGKPTSDAGFPDCNSTIVPDIRDPNMWVKNAIISRNYQQRLVFNEPHNSTSIRNALIRSFQHLPPAHSSIKQEHRMNQTSKRTPTIIKSKRRFKSMNDLPTQAQLYPSATSNVTLETCRRSNFRICVKLIVVLQFFIQGQQFTVKNNFTYLSAKLIYILPNKIQSVTEYDLIYILI